MYKGEKFDEVEIEVDRDRNEVRINTRSVIPITLSLEQAKELARFIDDEVHDAMKARGDFD